MAWNENDPRLIKRQELGYYWVKNNGGLLTIGQYIEGFDDYWKKTFYFWELMGSEVPGRFS
jgi:hypothetical protein